MDPLTAYLIGAAVGALSVAVVALLVVSIMVKRSAHHLDRRIF